MTVKEDRKAENEALVADLGNRVESLKSSDEWQRWLRTADQFRTYSFNNQLLIWIQCPDATMVTGYGRKDGSSGWLKLGRQVRKGEKALRIYAPILKWVTDDDTGERAKKLVGFRLVPVFDVSQTEGDPLPENPSKWGTYSVEGTEAQWDGLVAAAAALGFDVKVWDPGSAKARMGDAKGWFTPGTEYVNVVKREWGAMTKTLAHELSHALDEDVTKRSRGAAELVAESSAWLVAQHLNIEGEVDPETLDYLVGWGGDKSAVEAIAKTVLAISRKITAAVDAAAAVQGPVIDVGPMVDLDILEVAA